MPDEVLQNEEVSDPKDDETSDWTEVNALKNASKVKAYDIETLATSKIPQNIPYLEVYRTDELYYEPYVSPYLSMNAITGGGSGGGGGGSGDGSGSGGSNDGALWTELSKIMATYYPKATADYWIRQFRSAKSDWKSIATIVNRLGGDKGLQNNVIRKVLEAKKKYPANNVSDRSLKDMSGMGASISDVTNSANKNVERLRKDLLKEVRKNYKSGIHHSVIVKQYIKANNNRASVGAVTLIYRKYLKSGVNKTDLNTKIMDIKAKYS